MNKENPMKLEAHRSASNNRLYVMLNQALPYGLYEIVVSKKDQPVCIAKAIFNPPATIILWSDGTKTVVKCSDNDNYDPEKGLAMAIAKKTFGNRGKYYDVFKAILPKATDITVHDNPEDWILDFSDFADIFQNALSKAFQRQREAQGIARPD